MNLSTERNLGEQPLVDIMREHALKPHDLTVSSDEQITHKMVNRAMKGRRLSPHVQKKIVNALNSATQKQFAVADIFNYRHIPTVKEPVVKAPVLESEKHAPSPIVISAASGRGGKTRHQPKGLSVLYEDRDILVVDKRSGLLTVSTEKERENTAYFFLNNYVRKGNSKSRNRVFIVHRLDKDTSGVLVFAKTEEVQRFLQDEWQGFHKVYYAVVKGRMREKEGVITSYLAENRAKNMYSVQDPKKGALAKTAYKVVKESKTYSLLEIELLTGKKNQIRVHCADKGCPVAGDKKYGVKDKSVKRLALHAFSLTLTHPHTKETMIFEAAMPRYFEVLLND